MRNAASRRDAIPRIEGIGEGGQTPCLKLAAAHWMWPTAPRRQRFGPGRYPATDTTVQIPLSAAEHIYHGVLRYGLRAHTEFTGAPGGDRITLWLKALSWWSSRASRRPVTLPWSRVGATLTRRTLRRLGLSRNSPSTRSTRPAWS